MGKSKNMVSVGHFKTATVNGILDLKLAMMQNALVCSMVKGPTDWFILKCLFFNAFK